MEEIKKANFDVYVTKNYEMFKKLIGNRSVEEHRVKTILESIEEHGFLNNPILVNEKMEVIDGQGRLEALKRLGLQVYFCIHEGIGINECITLNLKQGNWKTIDYCKSYSEQGNENYTRLLDVLDRFKTNSPQLIYTLANRYCDNTGKRDVFSLTKGKIVFTIEQQSNLLKNEDFINLMLEQVHKYKYQSRYLIPCLWWAYTHKRVDQERFKDIVVNKFYEFTPYSNNQLVFSNISEIYNKGLSDKNRLYFDAMWKLNI